MITFNVIFDMNCIKEFFNPYEMYMFLKYNNWTKVLYSK